LVDRAGDRAVGEGLVGQVGDRDEGAERGELVDERLAGRDLGDRAAGDGGQQAGAQHLVPAVVLDLQGVLRVLLDERVADPGRPLADRRVLVLRDDLAGPDDDLRVALADGHGRRGGRRRRGGWGGGRRGGRGRGAARGWRGGRGGGGGGSGGGRAGGRCGRLRRRGRRRRAARRARAGGGGGRRGAAAGGQDRRGDCQAGAEPDVPEHAASIDPCAAHFALSLLPVWGHGNHI